MPTPEVLAHHSFARGEEVESGSQPCGRDLLFGHPLKRITEARPAVAAAFGPDRRPGPRSGRASGCNHPPPQVGRVGGEKAATHCERRLIEADGSLPVSGREPLQEQAIAATELEPQL